jgi:peptidoglycan/xylan/chitin deacetylase (PgdA/CDA1 family)
MNPSTPLVEALAGPFGCCLTVDVEEWYHTCLVPEYVEAARRPAGLAQELDRLLPELLELLAAAGRRATFFVLGEVAQRLPGRVREIGEAGHEVGSHSWHHLRAGSYPVDRFAAAVQRTKAVLEDLVGREVVAFRAPEWSLRHPGNPRLAVVAEAGHLYDSSLAPFVGAGRLGNPRWPSRIRWPDRGDLGIVELPPLTFGGPLSLPAGSWTGRLTSPERVAGAALKHQARGGMPLLVVHPWEVSGRPTPGCFPLGRFPGLARFIHEAGRLSYRRKFERLLAALPWEPIGSTLARAATGPVAAGRGGFTLCYDPPP